MSGQIETAATRSDHATHAWSLRSHAKRLPLLRRPLVYVDDPEMRDACVAGRGIDAAFAHGMPLAVFEIDSNVGNRRVGRELSVAEQWGPNGKNLVTLEAMVQDLSGRQVMALASQSQLAWRIECHNGNVRRYGGVQVMELSGADDPTTVSTEQWPHPADPFCESRHRGVPVALVDRLVEPGCVIDEADLTPLLREIAKSAKTYRLADTTDRIHRYGSVLTLIGATAKLHVDSDPQKPTTPGCENSKYYPFRYAIQEATMTPLEVAGQAMLVADVLDPLLYALLTQPARSALGFLPGDDTYLKPAAYRQVLTSGIAWDTSLTCANTHKWEAPSPELTAVFNDASQSLAVER